MNDLLRNLLDLRTLDWADDGVRFGFERPLPAWGWVTVIGVAALVAIWSYQRLVGRRAPRVMLGVARGLLLILLAVLVCGPQFVQRNETVERDWVLVLADRSASMTIADAAGSGDATTTRDEQLRQTIQKSWPMWSEIARERTIVWLGFSGGAFNITAPGADDAEAPALNLGSPDGRRTALGAALDQALARAVARPISGVIVISDGRSIDQPSRAAMRRLETDLIPVHAIALGSPDPVGDVAIRRVDAPRTAFAGDITPVRVELEHAGALAASAGARVRLVDAATGAVLDEKRITFDSPPPADGSTPAPTPAKDVTLTHLTDQPGNVKWAVEVVSDASDLIAGNNRAEISVDLVDRPMRVLYIDGYPRWEQRYLRNLLIREKSVTCSTLMLAPDRRFTQEGDLEVDALPDSPERWAEFDAIILGDVSPDVFTYDQLAQMRDHVAQRGAGLLWIAGPGATPQAWFDTPLADLLPFTKDAVDTTTLADPSLLEATPMAERLGIMRLGDTADASWPAELADPEAGWSQLRWVQAIDRGGLKPTSEILAQAVSISDHSAAPLVLAMRYGGGRSLYVATDEIWRWRYARGEILYERFWLQLIRMLARESLMRGGAPAILEVEPSRATVDQPVQVRVEVLDQSVADLALASITVEIVRTPEPGDPQPTPIELVLRPDQANSRSFAGIWIPPEAGRWNVRPTESALAAYRLSREVDVALPDDELRAPETDHPLLARLASETGGKVFTPDQVGQIAEALPNRQVRLVNEVAESLWDTPLALILAVFLLTAEWVGRRVVQLL